MNKSIISILLISTFLAPLAEAKRNQRRENRQQARIAEGVSSGQLTRPEARRLERGQNRVDHAQDKAMADGDMSAKEKFKIEKMQDRQNRRIYREKHDQQQRPDGAAAPAPETSSSGQ